MDTQILCAFSVYFCILTAIGLFFYYTSNETEAFTLGNRSINYFVTAISTQASDMSSWLFLGFSATVFFNGLPAAWAAIGLVIGMFCNWQWIAPRLRIATEHYESLTLSSYFEKRFGDTTGAIRFITSLATLVFFTFYIASGLVGLGRLFESAFGISYDYGITLGLACAIGYTLLGGFIAVAWCDLFQGLFLLGAIVVVPLYGLYFFWATTSSNPFDTLHTLAQERALPLTLFPSWSATAQGLLLAASWGLGYFGQPHILTSFMTIDDVANVRYAKYVGIGWQIIVLTAAAAVGIVGLLYYPSGIPDSPTAEWLFVLLTKQLFFPLIAGFILCGILAATLSTMDHQILIAGSTFAQDLYPQLRARQPLTSRTLVTLSRIGSLAIALLALCIARNNSDSIYNLVNYAWSGLASSFGPLVIFALYSKSTTWQGALAGVVVGATTAGLLPWYTTAIMPLVPGFMISSIAIMVVSKLTR